jgi:ribonuclease HI
LKKTVFEGAVVNRSRDDALVEAEKEARLCADAGRLLYWTDASSLQNTGGIGICYLPSTNQWVHRCWRVETTTCSQILEIYAIAKALELALQHYHKCKRYVKETPTKFYIYSDCVFAQEYFDQLRQSLPGLQQLRYGEELVGPGIVAANHLIRNKAEVELRYVPGHSGVQGNLKAHRGARKGAGHLMGRQKVCTGIEQLDKFRHRNRYNDIFLNQVSNKTKYAISLSPSAGRILQDRYHVSCRRRVTDMKRCRDERWCGDDTMVLSLFDVEIGLL